MWQCQGECLNFIETGDMSTKLGSLSSLIPYVEWGEDSEGEGDHDVAAQNDSPSTE